VETPTIFGAVDGIQVSGPGGTVYQFPGGLNLDYVPFAIPQITIGSLFGTDFTARYFSYNLGEDFGQVDVLGLGVRHSISQYVKLPVRLAVGAYHQSFVVGDFIEATNLLVNVQAGYSVSVLNLYGAVGYEKSTFKLDVEFDDESHLVFDMEGQNSVRFTVGASVDLGPLRVHADYNSANQSTFSAGLGIVIGAREKQKPEPTTPPAEGTPAK
jgi:hypothetical protein